MFSGLEDVAQVFYFCGHWWVVEKFSVTQVFYFCNGNGENFAHRQTFEILPLSTCTLCQQKILYLQRYSSDFRNLSLSSKMLRVDIWVESFRMRRYFTFAMARWKLCALTTFEILPLSTCTLCQQKSYISKGIQPIFEIFVFSSKMLGVGIWVVCFQVRRYFTFAIARWKLCASTTFEILPLSTCTLCQQKSYISKGIQPILFNRWAFGWKVSKSLRFLSYASKKFCHFQHVYFEPVVFNRFSKFARSVSICFSSCAQVFYFCNGKVKTLRIDNIWNFATFNMYTVPAKILYLQSYSTEFQNLCLSSKMFNVGIWRGMFQVRRYFTFAIARWKLCASTTFEILPLSTCTLCQQKSYISKGIQPIFEIFASARRLLRVGIWVESFRCAGILAFAMARWKLAHRQHLKFCHFQHVQCASKNPISPKVFNRFSKSLHQLEDVDGGHLGGKFQVTQVFSFCNGKVKTLRIDNIWNFATFNMYTVPGKNPISPKVFNRIFEIFASARRCWGWAFGWKVSGAQVFYFCNSKVKTLRIDNIWNFATFNMYTLPAKILYLRRYSTDFRNLCLSSKMLNMGIWVGKFQVRRYFTFAMARWKLCASTTFEILPLSTGTLCQQKSYISKGIQPIFEIFASARRCWMWAFGWKVPGAQVFYFCNGKVKTLRIDNIWNFATFNMYTVPAKILYLRRYSTDFRNLCLSSKMLNVGIWVVSSGCAGILLLQWQGENFAHRQHLKFCHFQPVHCQQKSYISKGIQPIFEIFPSARRHWGCAFGWIASDAQVFYFCNGKVKTLRIDNIWNFATFNLYTVPAKILYLQRYSTDFRNLCLSSKMLTVGILLFGWKVSGAQVFYFCNGKYVKILLCAMWKFRQHLKFCHFQHVHCASKNPISPKVFNRFSKSLHQLEDVEGGAFGWKVSGAQVFYFCNGKVKTLRIDNIWNFATFNMYTVPAKILYLQRYSTDFRNLGISSKMLMVGIWVESFSYTGILLLQWQGENLRIDNIWNFATFNMYTVPAKILYLQRYSTDFRNLCLSSKILRVGIWVESFRCAGILLLQWQGENFAHRQHLKFCHFQPVHCASKKSYISKGIQPIFEIFASARRCWRWALGWKVSGCAGILLLQ